jgi:digalactosyldiacylglycerol synthase
MTGTSINPLFRAAYLAKDGSRDVTLVIPWLSLKDQELVYPNKIVFDSPLEQEGYVRRWIEERVDFRPSFSIKFYPAKVHKMIYFAQLISFQVYLIQTDYRELCMF